MTSPQPSGVPLDGMPDLVSFKSEQDIRSISSYRPAGHDLFVDWRVQMLIICTIFSFSLLCKMYGKCVSTRQVLKMISNREFAGEGAQSGI